MTMNHLAKGDTNFATSFMFTFRPCTPTGTVYFSWVDQTGTLSGLGDITFPTNTSLKPFGVDINASGVTVWGGYALENTTIGWISGLFTHIYLANVSTNIIYKLTVLEFDPQILKTDSSGAFWFVSVKSTATYIVKIDRVY